MSRIIGLGFIILLSTSIILGGCRIRKELKEPLKEQGADYLFQQMKKQEFRFNTLSAKFTVEAVTDKKSHSIKGNLRIKKDSIIWLSLSAPFGMEIARMMITNDSIKFMNRLESTYFKGDYSKMNQITGSNLDFDILQALITGNDFTYYENDKFKASIENKHYKLQTLNRVKIKRYVKEKEAENLKILLQDIWLDPETFKIVAVQIKEIKENRKLEVKYDDFEAIGEQKFPFTMVFNVVSEKKMALTIQFDKVTTDIPIELPFTIPEKYNQMVIQEK